MIQAPDYLKTIIEANIPVTIEKDSKTGIIGFNLNSEAKSGMFLYQDPENQNWYISGRYNFKEQVENLGDVMSIFHSFYRMRDFGSKAWLNLLVKEGILEEKVEITRKVTYA